MFIIVGISSKIDWTSNKKKNTSIFQKDISLQKGYTYSQINSPFCWKVRRVFDEKKAALKKDLQFDQLLVLHCRDMIMRKVRQIFTLEATTTLQPLTL